MARSEKENLHDRWITALAVFIAMAGAFFIICWLADITRPLRCYFSHWPLPFPTAWCIFFSGLGLIAVLHPFRFLKEYCAAPVLLISSWRLLEFAFQRDLAMSGFFLKLLPYSPPVFPPITLYAASGFALVSLILFFWPRSELMKGKNPLLITLSSLLLLLGIIKFLMLLLAAAMSFEWIEPVFGHTFCAIALILLGTTFLSQSFFTDAYQKKHFVQWLSLFGPCLLLVFVYLIIYSISSTTRRSIQNLLNSKIESVEYQYRFSMHNNVDHLAQIAYIVAQQPAASFDEARLITSFLERHPEINRIYWTGPDFIVQKDYPSETAAALPVAFSAELHRHFIDRPSKWAIFLSLDASQSVLSLCAPMIRDGRFLGASVIELSLAKLFRPIIDPLDHYFVFNIFYKDAVIFSSNPNTEKISSYNASRTVAIENLTLTFSLNPAKKFPEFIIHRFVAATLLIGGIILSIILRYLILLWSSERTLARTNQRMALFSQNMLIAFNRRQTVNESCRQLLALINELYPWDALVLWQLKPENDVLECSEPVYTSFAPFPNFEQYLGQRPLTCKHTLAEQVLIHKKPIAIENLSQNAKYPCSCAAHSDEIRGALAFPIFEGDKESGVVSLFRREIFNSEHEPELMDLLPAIGVEFGQFLQRSQLMQSQEESSALIQNSAEAIFTVETNGTIKTWNPGAEKIYGWSAREIIGQNIFELTIPSADMSEVAAKKKLLLERSRVLNWETQRKRKDGSLIWVNLNISPIQDTEGRVIRFAVVANEITEQKNARIRLTQSEEKFRNVVENSDDWIWEMDTSGRYTFSNQSVQQILDTPPSEIVGRDLSIFLSSEDLQKIQKELELCVQKKTGWHRRQISLKKKNRAAVWIESSGMPFFKESGGVAGFRGVNRDVTEQMNIEQTKNEFISLISHELRTPLTSIVGSLGLLEADSTLTSKNAELIQLANRNAQRLTHILDDILDVEKIQLGKMELNLQKVPCAAAVREAIDIVKPIAEKNQVAIVEKPISEDMSVAADRDRLIQIMLNLLTNAIKFSPKNGKITVSMERFDHRVKISVQDEGKGIPPEFQSQIFEKFQQADQSDARLAGGTGLGLAICKQLLDLMNGSIYFKTQQNAGTVFYFELPIAGES